MKFTVTNNTASTWVRNHGNIYEIVNARKLTSIGDMELFRPIYVYHLKDINSDMEFYIKQDELNKSEWQHGIIKED